MYKGRVPKKTTEKVWSFAKPPSPPPLAGLAFFRKNIDQFFLGDNEPLMRETNSTLGPIQKTLYLLLLYQFIFAQNRPKSDISEALGPIHIMYNVKHYIKSVCNGIGG